ncbi:N-acetylmuramoyl-L-alanine amidase family protein [Chitinophagaceae bacterium MMS25-I14]
MRIRLLSFVILLSFCPGLLFATGKKITKIVLDAGHGGKDIGARGQFSQEKNLTLAIIMRLGKIINDSMKSVQVLYTRTSDVYPTLAERHEIANKSNADVFLSVHINSTADRIERVPAGTRTVGKGKHKKHITVYRTIRHHETSSNGTMTLVLGAIRNGQKSQAIEENGETIVEEPGLLNENDPQTAIILAQYMQAFTGRSVSLGSKIQAEFAAQGRTDLGVKQQSLEVLAGSAMPGVLVECGFINNPEEETYLNSEEGQTQVAMAIYRGLKAYKQDVER